MNKATFAGGCFWCMEWPFQAEEGVIDVLAGYAGGEEVNPTYKDVATGQTGHREAIQIEYDPSKISYEQLLKIFWRQIDPTDEGGQFADRGFHYTTAIYYHDDEQKKVAEVSKQQLDESGKFDASIVTSIEPYTSFYPAEESHQDYYQKNSWHYNLYKKGSGRAGFIEENWK